MTTNNPTVIDSTVREAILEAHALGLRPTALLDRDPWATDTEVDDIFEMVTHTTRYLAGAFEVALAHALYDGEDLGRDVTVRWESFDEDGRTCTREEFAVHERQLDGLIAALIEAKARLEGVAA